MPVSKDQHRLLYKIARAYYVDGLTQQQVANRFGLSRPKVSRLLHQARRERIVNITLVPPSGGLTDLEHELESRYGLEEVAIVSVSDPRDPPSVALELGPVAADLLVRCMSGQETVAITWGRTVLAMVNALPSRSWPHVTIVQMDGGLGPVDVLEHSTELARRMAQKFNADLRLLPAPGIVSSRAAAQALKSDAQISETLALAARADIAIVGLGVLEPDAVILRSGTIINQNDLELLKEAGAVGDVGLRFMNASGKPINLGIAERIIGLTLEQIAGIPRVIGVGGGEAKVQIIRAALHAHILDILVTDHATAQALRAHPDEKSRPENATHLTQGHLG